MLLFLLPNRVCAAVSISDDFDDVGVGAEASITDVM